MNTELKLVGTPDGVEVFKVPGCDNLAVSRCGRVWSIPRIITRKNGRLYTTSGKWIKQSMSPYGYWTVGNAPSGLVHRLLGMVFLGVQPGQDIDHINRVKTDNRLENLRIATRSENGHNKKARGYCWDRDAGKWRAYIKNNQKLTHLGLFTSEREARAAYVAAKRELGVVFPD